MFLACSINIQADLCNDKIGLNRRLTFWEWMHRPKVLSMLDVPVCIRACVRMHECVPVCMYAYVLIMTLLVLAINP